VGGLFFGVGVVLFFVGGVCGGGVGFFGLGFLGGFLGGGGGGWLWGCAVILGVFFFQRGEFQEAPATVTTFQLISGKGQKEIKRGRNQAVLRT